MGSMAFSNTNVEVISIIFAQFSIENSHLDRLIDNLTTGTIKVQVFIFSNIPRKHFWSVLNQINVH